MSSASLTAASIIFLAVVSALAVYRARGDAGATSFIVLADLLLAFFLLSVRWFEVLPPGDAARKRKAKVIICLSATSVNLLFSWKVSFMMPLGFAAVVWTISLTTVVAGFYLLFCLEEN
ncbi:unnamed protein product [Spirodela intermedia]|uniref:Uncharacterized protein n=1 Tax=Spirodela intermedia TaxID=51605 RepID=A0A7I8L5B4_SPIIN|nr:unnamed protein product [Spirodela intermedia]